MLILGNGGSGKSYLAKKLAKILATEPIHLDSFYWKNKWARALVEEWEEKLIQCMRRKSWVMEGTPMRDLAFRISLSDLVIFIDSPRYLCIYRVIIKGILKLFYTNIHHNDGCPVKGFSLKAICWVWKFDTKIKPIIFSKFIHLKEMQRFVLLKNKNEIQSFIENFSLIE